MVHRRVLDTGRAHPNASKPPACRSEAESFPPTPFSRPTVSRGTGYTIDDVPCGRHKLSDDRRSTSATAAVVPRFRPERRRWVGRREGGVSSALPWRRASRGRHIALYFSVRIGLLPLGLGTFLARTGQASSDEVLFRSCSSSHSLVNLRCLLFPPLFSLLFLFFSFVRFFSLLFVFSSLYFFISFLTSTRVL